MSTEERIAELEVMVVHLREQGRSVLDALTHTFTGHPLSLHVPG